MSKFKKNSSESLKDVVIYTDGACTGNPGAGGYGVVLKHHEKRKELSGGFRKTTNNRMELTAAIVGLQALKERCKVILFTDSQYLVDSISQGWARSWKEKNWMRNKRERAMNPDLWKKLLDLCEFHQVEIKWVRGHTGDPENERADYLATQAAKHKNLPPDEKYEKENDATF